MNSGISSDSIIVNIGHYLLVFAVVIILIIMLASLIIIPYFREKVKLLLKKILGELKFKTVIIYVTGAILDISFSVAT